MELFTEFPFMFETIRMIIIDAHSISYCFDYFMDLMNCVFVST